jgi:hypothetical protein
LAVAACSPSSAPPVDVAAPDELVNRVWLASDPGAPAGRIQIFLETGVLVSDSCWETYRLSNWRREGPDRIVWEEDGQPIVARIASISGDALRLRLELATETLEQSYRLAKSPYVCPDMPK